MVRLRGQALVEFTLVFPIIMLVVFGGIEWSLWQTAQSTAKFAAQSGALAVTVVGAPAGAGFNSAAEALGKGTLNALSPTSVAATCSINQAGHPCAGKCKTRGRLDQACSVAQMAEPTAGGGVVGISSFETETSGGQVVATVVVEGWIPAAVPLPILGGYLPVLGYAQLPVEEPPK